MEDDARSDSGVSTLRSDGARSSGDERSGSRSSAISDDRWGGGRGSVMTALASFKDLNIWWQDATLFLFIFFYSIHTCVHLITFIQYIYPSPFAEASLHFLIACMLSGKHLHVVPSRESNSALPYSKPTRYQLSHTSSFKDGPC
jgi:hypothetical protein